MKRAVTEMRRRGGARAAAAALAATLLLTAFVPPRGPVMGRTRRAADRAQEAARESRRLAPGKDDVAGEIQGGATHLYELALDAGRFVSLRLAASEADLALTLFGPGGQQLEEYVLQSKGPSLGEMATFVAESPGVYRLQLRAPAGAPARRYSLGAEVRPAEPRDKTRVAAARAFREGSALQYGRGGPEAERLRAAGARYQLAADLWREAGEPAREADALGSAGTVSESLREAPQAAEFFLRQLRIVREELQDAALEAHLSGELGRFYHESLRDQTNALRYLEAARRFYAESGEQEEEAHLLAGIGNAYWELGQTPEEKESSLAYLVQALALYRTLRNRYYEGDALGDLMRALRALGRPREAIFYGKLAINTFQDIRAGITDLERETQDQFIDSKEDVYRELADLLITEDLLWEAWRVLDLLKEEEHSSPVERGSKTRRRGKRPIMNSAELKAEKEHEKVLDQLMVIARETRELREKPDRDERDEKRLDELEKKLIPGKVAFKKYLAALEDEYAKGSRVSNAAITWKDGQSIMSDLKRIERRAVVLVTLVTRDKVRGDKYRVMLFTPDVPKPFERHINYSELRDKISLFRAQLASPFAQDHLPLAKELYDLLVKPVAKDLDDLGAKTLLWSLDELLRYVPVAALHDGERYLVERYHTAVIPEASTTKLQLKPSPTWEGVGFGVSEAYGDLEALPRVPAELQGIFRPTPTEGFIKGEIYLNDLFTEHTFMRGIRHAQLVHIATHFHFGDSEKNSYLLIGKGRILSLEQLENYNLEEVELLTLSACETAMFAQDPKGKKFEGLAFIALRTGAHAVVATLWRVADDGAQLFMQEFYRVRARNPGLTKAGALRCAQLSMLGSGNVASVSEQCPGLKAVGIKDGGGRGQFSHPYYWAPFLLLGNPQ
jgi:CHAT domain-containing protein